MPPTAPVKMGPRLDAKPWGGRRLGQWGIALPPDEPIGEALLTAPEAIVASGAMAGATLQELVASAPDRWIGARGRAAIGDQLAFPLLVKLIDAREDLSIQVHPDDRAAAACGLATGKTEAHHILAADPGSLLYLGLRDETKAPEFARACLAGRGEAAALLREVRSWPGMTVVVPGGTVHAIGAGNFLYEIQQPSNVTYRLDDWGRHGADGRPRELHHAAGLAVVAAQSRPEPIPRVAALPGSRGRHLLAATRFFALERIALTAGARLPLANEESPQVITVIAGAAAIEAAETRLQVALGETAIVPAGTLATASAAAGALLLRGWVPDLPRDVIGPARAAGASAAAMHALGIAVGQEPPPAD